MPACHAPPNSECFCFCSFLSCFVNETILSEQTETLSCVLDEIGLYKRSMNNEEMEEIKRHFGVVAEALRGDIEQIAEGHAVLRHELQSQREEMRDEFKETRSLMKLSFTQLDQRIRTLESDVSSLKSHVNRLESNQT